MEEGVKNCTKIQWRLIWNRPVYNSMIDWIIHSCVHWHTHWTIIWSVQGLQGSAPRGYSCFTAGQVTLPPPSPRPSPRERLHVKPTHTTPHTHAHWPPTDPCPPAGNRLNRSPKKWHTSWHSSKIHILQASSTTCGCQTETCSQEMRENATAALSFRYKENNENCKQWYWISKNEDKSWNLRQVQICTPL